MNTCIAGLVASQCYKMNKELLKQTKIIYLFFSLWFLLVRLRKLALSRNIRKKDKLYQPKPKQCGFLFFKTYFSKKFSKLTWVCLPRFSVEVQADVTIVYFLPPPLQQPKNSMHADSGNHHLIRASAQNSPESRGSAIASFYSFLF